MSYTWARRTTNENGDLRCNICEQFFPLERMVHKRPANIARLDPDGSKQAKNPLWVYEPRCKKCTNRQRTSWALSQGYGRASGRALRRLKHEYRFRYNELVSEEIKRLKDEEKVTDYLMSAVIGVYRFPSEL